MMKSLSVGLALAGEAERRAASRARDGAAKVAAFAVAGVFAFGALGFASVGAILMMGPALGPGPAAMLVAAGWVVLAAIAVVVALNRSRAPEKPVLPPEAGERMLAALGDDLGRNSPILALAALAIGAFTAQR